MILLIAHLLMSGAYAQDLDFATVPSVGKYCEETQPTDKLNNRHILPPPIGVDVKTTCNPNDSVQQHEYCVESVRCAYVPQAANKLMLAMYPHAPKDENIRDFDHLDTDRRALVIRNLEFQNGILPWLPTQVICLKERDELHPEDKNLYCPEPDECQLRNDRIIVSKGMFKPGYMDDMIKRVNEKKTKTFIKPKDFVAPLPVPSDDEVEKKQGGAAT